MGAVGIISPDDAAAPAGHMRKKKRYAYPAWLCLGSHYLYLDRPFTQLLFWLTLGGLLLWWVADFFRLPALVEEHNRRAEEEPVAPHEESLEQRLAYLEALARLEPSADRGAAEPLQARRRSPFPALVLASALAAAAALYVFNPPPLFPHSDVSFRTVRQVNVRDLPSTASPIRAVAARETVLSGTVVNASGGTARWLKIGRGSHSGGYVAVQNLETL
jgi:hypothetical protein